MLSTKNMITPLLELGLNKYEAKVYLTLISEGISTAKNISDITGIPYGKVYEIINSLSAKGFSMVLPTKPMKWQATSPKEAIATAKKRTQEKYEKLETHITKELEPLFTETKKFIEPKSIFWMINGRSNVNKKIDELIQKAQNYIYIHATENALKRIVIHKELFLDTAKRKVKIYAAGLINKNNAEDIKSLSFLHWKKTHDVKCLFFSVDGKESLIIEPIPDDDNIVYGRDLGVWIQSASFTKFLENSFIISFKRAREPNLDFS